MSVSICSLDFEDSVLNAEQGNIKSATTQVEDENVALTLILLVKTVCDGSSCWLIDDSLYIKS